MSADSEKNCRVWPDHFDKLMAAGFLILFTVIITILVLYKSDTRAFDWAKDAFSYFLGILSALMTGKAWRRPPSTEIAPASEAPEVKE